MNFICFVKLCAVIGTNFVMVLAFVENFENGFSDGNFQSSVGAEGRGRNAAPKTTDLSRRNERK